MVRTIQAVLHREMVREFLSEFLSTYVMMVSGGVALGRGTKGYPLVSSHCGPQGSYHSFPCL